MTNVYFQQDYERVTEQKKKSLTLFLTVTGIALLAMVGVFVWFILEPYGTKKEPWLLVLISVISGLYAIFAYIYLSICYARVKNYKKMLGYALTRKPTEGQAVFMHFNSGITVKDKVDFQSITFVEWSEKEKDYMERNVFFDPEKTRPDFRTGDEIRLLTYSNILVAYEVLNRTADSTN